MGEPLLVVEDLHIHFRTYDGIAKVVNGVNVEIRRGEMVALVGETGCGKSVTSKAILGLLPGPARIVRGDIRFRGRSLLNLPEAEWQQIRGAGISMVFQDPMTALNPVFTIGEQLMDVVLWQGRPRAGWLNYAARRFNRREREHAREKAIEMLRRVRIPDPARTIDRYPVELSGGMRQRVLIALALINEPELLIADEPGTALDVSVQDQVLALMKELAREQGTAILLITHNLGVARQVSDRIYVMYAGGVAETAPTDLVFRHQYHPYTQGLLQSIPKLTGQMGEGIDGRIPDYVNPPRGCRFYDRCPARLDACREQQPPVAVMDQGHQVACHLYAPAGRSERGRIA
ncbi:MAG: ABC transporter ATP-binding protein [Firmicutes bacterium]|nr:ABC transporter ATP-binding protein [Bacillota bacterium]